MKRLLIKKISALAGLFKIRITLFTVASSVCGFMLAPGREFSFSRPAGVAAGVLLLACGALIINQIEEAATDRLMPRTCARPVASGALKPAHAVLISVILISPGFCLLLLFGGALPAALGGLAVFWYALVYTPSKKVTAFALIPGALTGAIPPAIGWVSNGGQLFSPGMLILCFFFYIWQIPHFWLFLLRYGPEYEGAGLPSITNVFSERQLRRLIFTWEVCTAASAMLLAAFGKTGPFTYWLSALFAAWMIASGAAVFRGKNYQLFAWRSINACVLGITLVLGAGRLLVAG